MKTHLGHYEIIAELGRGGMGVVYKGYEPSLARFVAIKELAPALAHDPMVVERFLREARSMAVLNDPHIIQIYSIGQENEEPFFVMEFVDGASVAGLIKRDGHLRSDDAMKILHQTAQGLATAHDHGVIHRDVKPANLMLSQRGQVKIADFGIALANHDMNAKLTSAGDLVGTPGYLSPEILLGNPVDQRSDVYAVGVVLFEMLTGRTPFSDASVYKLMQDVVQREVPDVREINAEIDPGVASILARMLLKDPDKRYQSMRELISDLEKHPLITRGGPIKIKITTPGGSTDPLSGLASRMTPGVGLRAPTPPPEMGRRQAAVTPVTASSPPPPGSTVETQILSKPAAAPVQPAASVPAKKSRWPLLFASALIVLLAGGGWLLRGQLFGPAPTDTAVVAGNQQPAGAVAGKTSSTAKSSEGTENASNATPAAWYAPYKEKIVASYLEIRTASVAKLRPLLQRMDLKVSPELVFNLILILIGVIVFRSFLAWISRMRARRAYARRRAQIPLDGSRSPP
jgi:serine/threonine-protein kinase